MKNTYILLIAIAVTMLSCRTKEGEPGPAGESALSKQGVISGKISYVNMDGQPLNETFSYEYYESLADAYVIDNEDSYTISFSRRDLKDWDKKFEFNLYGSTDQSGNPVAPTEGDLNFSYLSVTNNKLFSFHTDGGEGGYVYFYEGTEGTSCDISNFSFNVATGRLLFDYKVVCTPDDISYYDRPNEDTEATIEGHVDVIVLNKKMQTPS